MKNISRWLLLIMVTGPPVLAQKQLEEKTFTFNSRIINHEFTIYISIPKDYDETERYYDLFFAIYNGEEGRSSVNEILNRRIAEKSIPPLIFVSVPYVDPRRDLTPTHSENYGPASGGADKYMKFIKEEIKPYLKNQYRINDNIIFWSHSLGSTFGIYALLKEPGLFQAYLLSSPWLIYDLQEKFLLKNTKEFLSNRKGEQNYIFACIGNEPHLIPDVDQFFDILEKEKPSGIKWNYIHMEDKDHRSILYPGLEEGLNHYRKLYYDN